MNKQYPAPAVVLINPKYDHNVSGVLRTCSCYAVEQLWWTGHRVKIDEATGQRLPREERMKGYKNVDWHHYDRPFDKLIGSPIAVELAPGAEHLTYFEWPDDPIFVFGPEDGSIQQVIHKLCHRRVFIPTHHCLNLAVSVGTILYDWRNKRILAGKEQATSLDEMLREPRGRFDNTEFLAKQLWSGK